jgi:peptidoglycan/LPS O-acetylase OafA/YrhL
VPAAAKLGALGVDLFFALSGYLICTLLLLEREETGKISLTSFYMRRAFRIAPPAITYLAIIAILGAAGFLTLRKNEIITAFYAANYFHSRSGFTAHYWSLSMEEHFYLFWPVALAVLGFRKAQFLSIALLGALLLYRPWAELHFDSSSYQHTDMRIDAFLLPC